MAIPKITTAEFEQQLRDGILSRNPTLDVTVGPIPDTVIAPVAKVLEDQNDRIRRLSLILSLLNVGEFTETEMDEQAFNEEALRSAGKRSAGKAIFQTRTAPATDQIVPANFPISTKVDPTLGRSILFRTTETRTLPAATAALFFNATSGFYELEVSIQAVLLGAIGDVGPNRITEFQASISGFESVTNRVATSRGFERETNEELAERLLIAIPGTDISTKFGIEREVLDSFADVVDITTVFGLDPLLTRAETDAGAVDAYIIGQTLSTRTEAQTFLGVGQTIVLNNQPVSSVASVSDGVTTYVQGTDYVFLEDAGANGGSVRSQDGVVFIAGGAAPATGASLTIIYNQNTLMQTLQDGFIVPDLLVFGRDLLFREGTQKSIEMTANLSVLAGSNASVIQAQVLSALVTFINSFGLGDDVEGSDLNAEVRRIAGVDNLVITLLHIKGSALSTADIPISKTEYARTTSTDVTVTLV